MVGRVFFCRTMLCKRGLCHRVVYVRPSVRLSRSYILSKPNKARFRTNAGYRSTTGGASAINNSGSSEH